MTLAISDVGGARYTEIIPGIDRELGRVLPDEDTLLIIYDTGDEKLMATVDLSQPSVIKTTELPFLGTDVE